MSSAKLKLTVSSDRGSPDPPVGITTYNKGEQISCKVTSPVTEGAKVWTCKGWAGIGSVPQSGVGTNVTFPLDQDSTITWNWTEGKRWGGAAQWASLIAFALIIFFAGLSYALQYVFLTAVLAGAIGGLLHEIVQSKGTYMLPNTDDKGNFCLGGLIGIISGGLAGLILYQGLNVTTGITVSGQLFTEALLAGLAAKGVADAVNPPSK